MIELNGSEALLSPPGDTIRDTMECKRISLKALASGLQLSPHETTELLNGAIAIDLRLASRLEAILKIPSSFWINRETIYRHELSMVGK